MASLAVEVGHVHVELACQLGDATAELLALHLEALAPGDGGAQEAGQRHAGDLHRRLEGQEQARARALVAGELGDVLAVEEDGALVHAIGGVAHDQVAQGRLAGAVGAHEDVGLAGGDVQVHAVQDGFLVHRRGEAANGEERVSSGGHVLRLSVLTGLLRADARFSRARRGAWGARRRRLVVTVVLRPTALQKP